MIRLDTPLHRLSSLGARYASRFGKLGVHTVRDLLFHFPARYEDFRAVKQISDLVPHEEATIHAVVESAELRQAFRRHLSILHVVFRDVSGTIDAYWFNQPYLLTHMKVGARMSIAGTVTIRDGVLAFQHPAHEPLGSEETEDLPTHHTGRLVAVYPETHGLTSKVIRAILHPLFPRVLPLGDWIPPQILRAEHFPDLSRALRDIHMPQHLDDALRARERFAFEDLFLLQMVNAKEESLRTASPGPAIPTDLPYVRSILKTLPYALTHSQKQALWDVLRDMAKPIPMNRLIQGDVGSGKTVVAACAALVAHTAGYQTAYMAPTEVLAHQHLETFSRIAGNAPGDTPVVALLTARGGVLSSGEGLTRTAPKKEIRELVKRGEIHIVIGTHALIAGADPIPFRSLGLVMVDEQHRFGVRERARLAERKSTTHQAIPHFLSMSATPIPRTLMLTVFGNLALSVIDELPPGRTPVTTHIYTPAMRSRAYALIRAQVALGHQAFVICPRIESADPHPDAAERKSVKKEFDALSKTIFRDLRIRMLHGQMKADEKKNVMRAFHDGMADILVATSVVEVGVDLPRATIIMIEGAERFGLAQLYQLRGRVGRSSFPSTCLLMTESDAAAKSPRLLALQRAANGFALAEEDLKLRGPGEFLGSAQTGLPDVAMDALKNPLLVVRTKEMAERLFAEDPSLRAFPELHETLRVFEADLHRE